MLDTSQESVPQILYENIWCCNSYRFLNFSYNTKLFIYPIYQFFEALLGMNKMFHALSHIPFRTCDLQTQSLGEKCTESSEGSVLHFRKADLGICHY